MNRYRLLAGLVLAASTACDRPCSVRLVSEPFEPRSAPVGIQRRQRKGSGDFPRLAHLRGVPSGRSCAQGCLAEERHVDQRGRVRHLVAAARCAGKARDVIDGTSLRSAREALLGRPAPGRDSVSAARRQQLTLLGRLDPLRQDSNVARRQHSTRGLVGTPARVRASRSHAERRALGIPRVRAARRSRGTPIAVSSSPTRS
jgi:hypothetical protein